MSAEADAAWGERDGVRRENSNQDVNGFEGRWYQSDEFRMGIIKNWKNINRI